jgi:hypothetical protein
MKNHSYHFLSAGESGATDPFYGNVTVASVAGTRWYELKESSSSLSDDYASIDWDDFYLTTINVAGETSPYVSKGLKFLSLADWKRYYRDSENVDDADSQAYGEPSFILNHQTVGNLDSVLFLIKCTTYTSMRLTSLQNL